MTPQQYVDQELARHRAALATAPIVEGILTHGRAIAELRRIRRRQYRPRMTWTAALHADLYRALDPVDEQRRRAWWQRLVDGQRHDDDRTLPEGLTWHDEPAPATSPIYAQLRQLRGWDR